MDRKINKFGLAYVASDEIATAMYNQLTRRKVVVIFISILVILTLVYNPMPAIFLSIVYVSTLLGIKELLIHRKFLRTFAAKHGYTFSRVSFETLTEGRLFNKSSASPAHNIVSGTYGGYPIRFFNYNYSTGSGKSRTTHKFTVCEITIPKTVFPFVLLLSESMSVHQARVSSGQEKDVRVKLPESVEKNFDLLCTQNYEIEVLEIFTEDFLTKINDLCPHLSIELAGSKVNIYDDSTIKTSADLENMHGAVKMVIDTKAPLLERLHDDFEAMHQFHFKKDLK